MRKRGRGPSASRPDGVPRPGATLLVAASLLVACGGEATPPGDEGDGDETAEVLFRDVTASHLPVSDLEGLSMDAHTGDLDGDGDPDIVIANEHRPNILLINDGSGRFATASGRLPSSPRDSEDVGIADFDGDGDLDVIVVSEDDEVNELYMGDGRGGFTDGGERIPVTGTSNAVVVADLNGDGAPDVLIGNNGQNFALINDGAGSFTDETAGRLPARDDVTQDLELGDADGDGDADLLVGNEDANRLLFNDGSGVFSDPPERVIPLRDAPEETREADFGDVDGDGDPDVVTSNSEVRMSEGQIVDAPYRVYLNDGGGVFREATVEIFPPGTVGTGFDAEFADFDGDGLPDLYLASRGSADRLLLARPR